MTATTAETRRIDVDQPGFENYVDVTVREQADAETGELLVRSVEWVERTFVASEGRFLRGPKGEAVYFAPRAGASAGRPAYVRSYFESGFNSYSDELEGVEEFTADDLLAFADASYACVHPTTSPFRPYAPARSFPVRVSIEDSAMGISVESVDAGDSTVRIRHARVDRFRPVDPRRRYFDDNLRMTAGEARKFAAAILAAADAVEATSASTEPVA